MALGKDELPLRHGQLLLVDTTVRLRASAGATVDKGAGISGVAQYLKNAAVARDRPRQIPLLLAHALAARKAKTVLDHLAYRLESRPGALKGIEHEPQGGLYRGIGVQPQHSVVLIHKPDRRHHLELSTSGFVQHAAAHPRFENMQLRFTHRALQPQHQPIVEAGRVIRAVLVQDQRSGHRAQLDQPVPICGVTRQARHLQAHHDPGLTQRHLAHELLKAIAMQGARAGFAQIVVDHVNAFERPAVGDGTLP